MHLCIYLNIQHFYNYLLSCAFQHDSPCLALVIQSEPRLSRREHTTTLDKEGVKEIIVIFIQSRVMHIDSNITTLTFHPSPSTYHPTLIFHHDNNHATHFSFFMLLASYTFSFFPTLPSCLYSSSLLLLTILLSYVVIVHYLS